MSMTTCVHIGQQGLTSSIEHAGSSNSYNIGFFWHF